MKWLETGDARIRGLMTLTDGRKFYGTVEVNSVLRTQNDIADYLLQVNRAATFPHAGDAVLHDGRKFMLGDGVTEFSGGPLFRSLRMITVTTELAWSRVTTTTETLSGLAQKASAGSLGTALVCMQATSKFADAFHVSTSKYGLITNAAVAVDDRLGNFIVTFVEIKHGLSYAEAR